MVTLLARLCGAIEPRSWLCLHLEPKLALLHELDGLVLVLKKQVHALEHVCLQYRVVNRPYPSRIVSLPGELQTARATQHVDVLCALHDATSEFEGRIAPASI